MKLCTNIWSSSINHYTDRFRPRGVTNQLHSRKWNLCILFFIQIQPEEKNNLKTLLQEVSNRPSKSRVPAARPLHGEAGEGNGRPCASASDRERHRGTTKAVLWSLQKNRGQVQGPGALRVSKQSQVAAIARTRLAQGWRTGTSRRFVGALRRRWRLFVPHTPGHVSCGDNRV